MPHDKRFEPFDQFPKPYSKTKRDYIINFTQTIPRDDKLMTVNLTPSTYNCNHELLMPRLTKSALHFQQYLNRMPLLNRQSVRHDSIVYDNIERYFAKNSKFKKPGAADFTSTVPRGGTAPGSVLPSFMENIHDRNSIQMLSKKMLETNHFGEGNFQSVISSFEPRNTYRVGTGTFGNPMARTAGKFNPRQIALGELDMKRTGSVEGGMTYNSVLQKTGILKRNPSEAVL